MMTAESYPNLTGAAFDLANAGYSAMPDRGREEQQEAIGSDSASLREVAEQAAAPPDKTVVREYTGTDGELAAPNEAVTLDRAARDFTEVSVGERSVAGDQSSERLAAHIDALRAEAFANDPSAAEFYGFDRPEPAASQEEGGEAQQTSSSDANAGQSLGLDPDLEKLMQHPQVRLALEEKVGEVERARRGYVDGLAAAIQLAQASFVSEFPELAGLPPEQLPTALQRISHQDTSKLARIQAIAAAGEQLSARHRQEQTRHAETARQNFRSYAQSEAARLATMLQGESEDVRQAVAQEIRASAKASGIEPDELHHLFESAPLMRNATFQRMMYDAGKFRLMMKAKDAVATRPVPPVQRPGMAGSPGDRDRSDLHALNAKLSNSGDLKDAVALYQARKAGGR